MLRPCLLAPALLLPALFLLAACGEGTDNSANAAAPAPVPSPTGPPPMTPQLKIAPGPSGTPAWMKAAPVPGAATDLTRNVVQESELEGTTKR